MQRMMGPTPFSGRRGERVVVVESTTKSRVEPLHLVLYVGNSQPMWRELDGRVEPERGGIVITMLDHDQMKFSQACLEDLITPGVRGSKTVVQPGRAIDHEQSLSVNGDVSIVRQRGHEIEDEPAIDLGGMLLADEDFILETIPTSSPVLIRPADTERKGGRAARQDVVQRPLEQSRTGEPVVVVAEAMDTVACCEIGLSLLDFLNPQVVVAQIRRSSRLGMALEHRPTTSDIPPLGEASAPPGVVLRDRVELRKIEGDCSGTFGRHERPPSRPGTSPILEASRTRGDLRMDSS